MTEAAQLLAEAEDAIETWLCELDAHHGSLIAGALEARTTAAERLAEATAALEEARKEAAELVTAADEHAGRLLAQARNEAEELVAASRQEARRIVDDAEDEAERRLASARAELERSEAAAADAASVQDSALVPEPPVRRRGLRRIFSRG